MASLHHITIVLVRPQQPGNIGVAARAIANHGVGRLALVCPSGFDPDRARWMAPKAHHIINHALYCRSVSEAVAESTHVMATTARPRSQDWVVRTPLEAAQSIAAKPRQTAILFGPEDSGLSNEDLELAESIITFPTTQISSLNLGQAVTATCAALRMGAEASDHREVRHETVSTQKREELVRLTMESLHDAGYLDGRSRRLVKNTLMKLSAKTNLSDEETNNLLGMAKQVHWWCRQHD